MRADVEATMAATAAMRYAQVTTNNLTDFSARPPRLIRLGAARSERH
jgi:hypothetical protein